MVHADGPRTWGTEAGGSQFDGTLGSIDTVSKTNKGKKKKKQDANGKLCCQTMGTVKGVQ